MRITWATGRRSGREADRVEGSMNSRTLRDRARRLRREMTDAERRLWSRLRKRQVLECQFRRQFQLGGYIVDFVCLERRLIVEVDGGQHAEQEAYDAARTDWLEEQDYRVLRFWNDAVLTETDAVIASIAEALTAGG